jgi:Type IX secretion system protein PorV
MNKMKLVRCFLILALFASGSIFADGGSRNGTAGAAQLLIPVGARGVSMSGSTLTDATGVEAIYWNPANLARGDANTNLLFSHMNYIADINVEYGAISTNIDGFGSIGFTLKSLNIGSIPITTVDNPDGTGATFTPNFSTVGVSYARLLSDRIAVGITANLISETLDLVSTTGIAFNVGISYKNLANINGLSFAVVVKNLGPQMKYDGSGLDITADAASLSRPPQLYKIDAATFELPSSLELGLGYVYNISDAHVINVDGSFASNNFYGDEYKVGLEYGFNKLLFLRGGYDFVTNIPSDSNIYGMTAGIGINYAVSGFAFKFDYAFRAVKYFSANHVFTVTLGF